MQFSHFVAFYVSNPKADSLFTNSLHSTICHFLSSFLLVSHFIFRNSLLLLPVLIHWIDIIELTENKIPNKMCKNGMNVLFWPQEMELFIITIICLALKTEIKRKNCFSFWSGNDIFLLSSVDISVNFINTVERWCRLTTYLTILFFVFVPWPFFINHLNFRLKLNFRQWNALKYQFSSNQNKFSVLGE